MWFEDIKSGEKKGDKSRLKEFQSGKEKKKIGYKRDLFFSFLI